MKTPLEHRCGYCGKTAERIETCASDELAVYHCFHCQQKTIVDLTRLPRFTEPNGSTPSCGMRRSTNRGRTWSFAS
jgi:hypothetical protein